MAAFADDISGFLDWLRADIRRTNFTNWEATYNNAQAHVVNTLSLVQRTPDIDAAASRAITETQKFAQAASNLLSSSRLDSTRLAALTAVDEFALTLNSVKLSG